MFKNFLNVKEESAKVLWKIIEYFSCCISISVGIKIFRNSLKFVKLSSVSPNPHYSPNIYINYYFSHTSRQKWKYPKSIFVIFLSFHKISIFNKFDESFWRISGTLEVHSVVNLVPAQKSGPQSFVRQSTENLT